MTPHEILALCREKDVKAVNIRFCDLLGVWRQITVPIRVFAEEIFAAGVSVNGSSLPGWQSVHHSDLVLIPQNELLFVDPFAELTTLNIVGEIQDPKNLETYELDPRGVARRTEAYLRHTAVADEALISPEAEFHVFDDARFDQSSSSGFYFLDAAEAEWNRGKGAGPNPGHRLRPKSGYAMVPPGDQLVDLRSEIMQSLLDCGVLVSGHRHEAGSAGQSVVNLQPTSLLRSADLHQVYKYVVKSVAQKHGKSATFMPQPVHGEAGSGLHLHLSLWKDGKPLFSGSEYGGLSETALFAIGGVIKHAAVLAAFTNPTTNSFKRVIPGTDPPSRLGYATGDRSVACRIPLSNSDPGNRRLEFRFPDSSCNPYLAFSAIVMAAIDGIQNNVDPGQPIRSESVSNASTARFPVNLNQALVALEKNHQFLLKGDVFTEELIDNWILWKRTHEVDAMRFRPHPYEFCLYYDV